MVGEKPAARAGCGASRSRPHPGFSVCGTRHWCTRTPCDSTGSASRHAFSDSVLCVLPRIRRCSRSSCFLAHQSRTRAAPAVICRQTRCCCGRAASALRVQVALEIGTNRPLMAFPADSIATRTMRRAAIERFRTLQTWRDHLAVHGATIFCDCELQPGRFRKSQRIGGCGRSRCWLCHYEKLAGCPTVHDLRSLATEREGLAELRAIAGTDHGLRFVIGVNRRPSAAHEAVNSER